MIQGKPQLENLEDAFQNIFSTSVSGSGEEELLRIASQFSLQLSGSQIKCLLFLELWAEKAPPKAEKIIRNFITRWVELKRNNNSDAFVMRALDSISLRKFINEGSFKVNVEK